MNTIYLLTLILSPLTILAQTTISGKVTDRKDNPIPGANVFIKFTYDGSSTDKNGNFKFTTNNTDKQTLIVSFVGFNNYILTQDVATMNNLHIKLSKSINALNAVKVTAGTFSAGDPTKAPVLSSLDVVTTAGAAGNLAGAFQTLPGTSTVGESGRLFIRGGNSNETQTFIDGMRVFSPYSSSPNNIPSRSRYSPMLFKGMTFSTGGYSAEYGQALSGILILNTEDFPVQENTNISLMSVGAALGHNIIGKKDALTINTSYYNLAPYQKIVPDRFNWKKFPQNLSGEAVYRHRSNNGMLKVYTAFANSHYHILQNDINSSFPISYNNKNDNLYINSSYHGTINDNWIITTGASISHDKSRTKINSQTHIYSEEASHLKIKLKYLPNERLRISMGTEHFISQYKNSDNITHQLSAIYSQFTLYITPNTLLTAGIRGEYSNYTKKINVAPRFSLAHKAGKYGQFSLAVGTFYQMPEDKYVVNSPSLTQTRSNQFILNYQYNKNNQTLRLELFRKKYNNLVKFTSPKENGFKEFSNNGYGYANGLDLFWKDGKTIKNLEYWLSYSYLDTKRDHLDYPEKSQPGFINKHNFSLVTKYWLAPLRSQIGITYQFASGRNYHDPNQEGFMNAQTRNYNNLSFNWSWLISQQKIFFFSISNVPGFNNIYGYNYSHTANPQGGYQRMAIRPSAQRFLFAGLFITISKDKTSNQLKNL